MLKYVKFKAGKKQYFFHQCLYALETHSPKLVVKAGGGAVHTQVNTEICPIFSQINQAQRSLERGGGRDEALTRHLP